jgi:hypothetical protein
MKRNITAVNLRQIPVVIALSVLLAVLVAGGIAITHGWSMSFLSVSEWGFGTTVVSSQ